jgi:hypothetical protein
MVAGKILKKHGKLVYPHLQDLFEKARESQSRILNKNQVEIA